MKSLKKLVLRRGAAALAAALAAGSVAGAAGATPRPLPFTYPPQTLPERTLELEQYADVTPVRVERETDTGTEAVASLRSILQTELEYGVTDQIEVAWYFEFRQNASPSPVLRFHGVKQRVRFALAPPGVWPIDVGLYFEAGEAHNEVELEQKILLGRRFGRLGLFTNLWVEQEYYFQDDDWKYVYNPTFGATFDVSSHVTVGAEYWVRGRFDEEQSDPDVEIGGVPTKGPHHYLGPTLLFQRDEVFIAFGAYSRLDGLGESAVVGDPWGKYWFRTLIGIHL